MFGGERSGTIVVGLGEHFVPQSTTPTTASAILQRVRDELAKTLVGQDRFIDRMMLALLAGGHLLIEGVPGLAKTLAAESLARVVGAKYGRVQFTPDLLPADLVGTEIYQPASGEFTIRPGPIFAEILLADEINRAPAKVQSALLEAMQEQKVTIGHETLPLPELFLVLATQNPIEQEGTYPLPEAQIDRFFMKVLVTYPSKEDERRIVNLHAVTRQVEALRAVLEPREVLALRPQVDAVHVEPKVGDYILDVVRATRDPAEYGLDLGGWLDLGASPRGAMALTLACKAHALLNGRDYVVPHDVKVLAPDVLRHRLILGFEAEADGIDADFVIGKILSGLAVP